MIRIRINEGKVGLVFKNGDYKRVITAGKHWLKFNESVKEYDLSTQFYSNIALDLLLKDERLTEMLEVVDVKDSEIVVVYQNSNFFQVLEAGRYAFWKGLINRSFQRFDKNELEVGGTVASTLYNYAQFNKHIRVVEVTVNEKALLFVDDKFTKTLTGGTYRFWRNDVSIKVARADMRQRQIEISGQELLTKDKATIRINFDTQFQVVAIEKALLDNKDYEKQLYTLMQMALRIYVGNYSLDDLLSNKEAIAQAVFEDVNEKAEKLGVKILTTGIRDVILTGDMKEIMNQVLIAQKKAQANIITRREETASTRSLLNTAKLMEENDMLFKLKEMEYVEKIADKVGEISVSGNGNMVKQLKEIFVSR